MPVRSCMSLPIALLAMTLVAPHLSTDAALRERVMTIVANSGAEVAVALQHARRPRRAAARSGQVVSRGEHDEGAGHDRAVPAGRGRTAHARRSAPHQNEFHSIVDGSVYQLSVGDDSDAEVYKEVGKTLSLRQLCEAMITVSSNFAANLLIERVGVDNMQDGRTGSARTACRSCAASRIKRRSTRA